MNIIAKFFNQDKVNKPFTSYLDAYRDLSGNFVSDVDDSHEVYINQFYAEDFNRNEAGWPRNDISAFEKAESDSEASAILMRLQEQEQTNDVWKDLSDDEKFELCVPRRATTDAVLYSRYLMLWAELEQKRLKQEMDDLEKSKQEEEAAKAAADAEFADKVKDVVNESSKSE